MDGVNLNKSDYKIIIGYLIIATIWLIIKFYTENYTLVEYLIDIPVFWLQVLTLLLITKALINIFFIKYKNYFALIASTIFMFWFLGFLTLLSGEITRSGTIDWNKLAPFMELFFFNVNSSAANVAIPLTIISAKKFNEYQLKSIALSNAQKELELKLLRSQFNPHFLYNSLNTIDALVDYSPKEKVKEYISNLASLYRYLIKTNEEDIVTLKDEILLAKNYIYLIETRFENDYQFIISNNYEHYNDKYLPNGSLLTALENVIKHNKPLTNRPIITTITINENEMKISNILSKKNTGEPLRTGLENLNKRYGLLSDKIIEIKQTEEEFSLTLPLLTAVNH